MKFRNQKVCELHCAISVPWFSNQCLTFHNYTYTSVYSCSVSLPPISPLQSILQTTTTLLMSMVQLWQCHPLQKLSKANHWLTTTIVFSWSSGISIMKINPVYFFILALSSTVPLQVPYVSIKQAYSCSLTHVSE